MNAKKDLYKGRKSIQNVNKKKNNKKILIITIRNLTVWGFPNSEGISGGGGKERKKGVFRGTNN